MPKIVNTAVEIAASGLELTSAYVVGAAPIAPIIKLGWIVISLVFAAFRSIQNRSNNQENIHVE